MKAPRSGQDRSSVPFARRARAVLCVGWAAAMLAGWPGSSAIAAAAPATEQVLAGLPEVYPELEALYIDLHQTPELSFHEEQTAAKLAERLRGLGFEVTTGVGGTGVVGLLRNGDGPTVMVRTDLDGLPVEERTGLPYASTVRVEDPTTGSEVGVMHACGHDVHMTAWMGTATLLSRGRSKWSGTLMMIGQPAEERGSGAKQMLADGLYERFPKPDYALAIHDSADLPAGQVGVHSGFALASVDSVDITVYGAGGHGAYPHKTIDPVLIAARIVVALQSIVAREINPLDPAVVTVGSIHGGTKHNIIPDDVHLQLTVRSYKDDVREHLLAAIERIARAEAEAGNAPKPPDVEVSEGTPATYNDPELSLRVTEAVGAALGQGQVVEVPSVMGGEDFSEFTRAGVPGVIMWVGAVNPDTFRDAKAEGKILPSLHSPLFAPDREPTLRTAITAETAATLELLSGK